MTAKRLLIVDDNVELRDQVQRYLTGHEFEIEVATDAIEMDRVLARVPVDLIILDLMLPGEDGLSICRRLTMKGEPPIIMVSAAGDEVDRVLGLEFGADDYLPKPFGPRELLARVRAVLRRHGESSDGVRAVSYSFEGFTYDPTRRELRAPDRTMILLTAAESTMLGVMLMNAGRVVPRDELILQGQMDPESRAIDISISRLRQKLAGHGGGHLIHTKRGSGYGIYTEVAVS